MLHFRNEIRALISYNHVMQTGFHPLYVVATIVQLDVIVQIRGCKCIDLHHVVVII
jgi:hypothetical protein